jgi:hypothetical protein
MSKNRRTAILGAVVLLALVLLSLKMRDSWEAERLGSLDTPAVANAGRESTPLIGDPAASIPSTPAATTVAPVTRSTPTEDTPIAEEVALPAPLDTGETWLVGEVTDPNGTKVEGVVVRLGSITDETPVGMGGAGRATVEKITELDRAATDANGWYEIPLPLDLRFSVMVDALGYESFRTVFISRGAQQTLDERGRRLLRVDVRLMPGAVFAGRVVDQDAKPVAGGAVRFVQWRPAKSGWSQVRCVLETTSDAEGRFRLAGARGDVGALYLSAEHHASAQHTVSDVTAEQDWVLSSVGGAISGRVVMRLNGDPMAGVRVEAWKGSPENQGNVDETVVTSVSDAEGRFRIEPLVAGIWDVTARTDTMRVLNENSALAVRVVLGEMQIREDLVLTIGTGWDLSGVVVNAVTGEPVADAIVSEGFAGMSGETSTISDGDGRFTLKNVFGQGNYGGGLEAVILAEKPGLALVKPAQVALEGLGLITGIRVEMVPEVEVTGTVRDDRGRPVAALQVSARDGISAPSQGVFTDAQGRFVLAAPANAKVQVVALVGELRSYSEPFDVGTQPVSGIVLTLDPGGDLIVKCTDEAGKPAGDLTIWMMNRTYAENWSSAERFMMQRVSGADGYLSAKALPSHDSIMPMELENRSLDVGIQSSDQWMDTEERGIVITPRKTTTVVLKLKPKEATHFIDGVVLDWQRNPVEGAVLQAWSEGGRAEVTSDALGAFRFEKLSPGTYSIEASHPSYGHQRAEEVSADSAGVELVLGTGTRWSAKLLDSFTGEVIMDALAVLTPDEGYPVEVDAVVYEGVAIVGDMIPGRPRHLTVTAPGYEAIELDVLIPEGEQRVRTELHLVAISNAP